MMLKRAKALSEVPVSFHKLSYGLWTPTNEIMDSIEYASKIVWT